MDAAQGCYILDLEAKLERALALIWTLAVDCSG